MSTAIRGDQAQGRSEMCLLDGSDERAGRPGDALTDSLMDLSERRAATTEMIGEIE